jgi:hypothetical protein
MEAQYRRWDAKRPRRDIMPVNGAPLRPILTIADPVPQSTLWREFGLDKAAAYRLWQSHQCAGQLWRGKLVLSRADVERLAKEIAPVMSRG